MDTSEEALLIQDWLKLKMIRSSIPVLVDSALRDLDPQQLVLFIQSFGIPVDSMTKLLQTLDTAVTADLEGVNESVLDKAYMGQLVAVQHKRGAQGGLVFARALNLDLNLGDMNTDIAEVNNVLPNLSIPPRPTALIPPGHVKTTLLHIFDVGSPARMNAKERQDTFRTLQKILADEISSYPSPMSCPMIEATMEAIQSIIKSQDLSTSFLSALCQKTPFSVGLLRLITNGLKSSKFQSSPLPKTLLDICHKILKKLSGKQRPTTPLMSLLNDFVKEMEPSVAAAPVTEDISGPNIEDQLKIMAHEALGKSDTKDLVSKISSMLLEDKHQGQTGLLVDWLELLDPTIISSCPDLQMKLVFGKTIKKLEGVDVNDDKVPAGNCRPYLLSLLTHQASYTVLRSTVSSLLASFNTNLEPSSVLDFLSASIQIPRLWQGRDQRPPKHHKPEDVLQLEGENLINLVEYVIEEATNSGEKPEDVVKDRVHLVLRCLSTEEKIGTVMEHLVRRHSVLSSPPTANSLRLSTVKIVIMELYLRIPGCFNSLLDRPDMDLVSSLSVTSALSSQSVLDTYTHTLLSGT